MGLFDWIIKLIGAAPRVPERRFQDEGICPYCGSALRTTAAQQCFVCGIDWHDPSSVVVGPASSGTSSWQSPTVVPTPAAPSDSDSSTPKQRAPATLARLDGSPYAPISRDELASEAASAGRGFMWGNAWFGRRDLIPPEGDKRTDLIDRAMVTEGLITPEELQHIHVVGAKMDEVRPAVELAKEAGRQAGQKAVAASREQRETLKKQKQEEALARKKEHAEAVARRHRTDIIFLGRRVSHGLADRRANVEKLGSLDLPVLATPADVAEAMEISVSKLRWLAFDNEAARRVHYIQFSVPKRNGGTRQLAAPHRSLRKCQQWIAWHVLAKVPVHAGAHGFVRGRGTVSNAKPHVGAGVLVNTDVKDFFPSITFPRVRGIFAELGYSTAAATILALLTTESPRETVDYNGTTYHVATGPRALPQGACTSPALSNLVSRRLDARLSGLAEKLGWAYTRYADDTTFSARHEASEKVGYLLARIRHIVADEGFALNETKTRVLRRNTSQQVTGIVVNRKLAVPRKQLRRLRAILHQAKTGGLAAQNRQEHPFFEQWVHGMVAYIEMVNPRQAQPLRKALADLESP